MSIGTFLIVYRVYYQQRRIFGSRHSAVNSQSGAAHNKAKSLFYLLFTLNLLYFILVSPVVLVTTILFRDPNEEVAYPRFKAIIYLMQYCNHSLNFIFYGKFYLKQTKKEILSFLGITSPPYRRILYEWLQFIFAHLPQCCRRKIQRQPKSTPTATTRIQASTPQHVKITMKNDQQNVTTTLIDINSSKMKNIDEKKNNLQKESISLLPR
jgi:hypothetical protein